MSILNLNAPQGRGPIGKKKTKIWMGVGLLVAVLGIGSTFAANISLNSPGGTTEFGQGVSQTVYCGGSESVVITPISTYSNTVVGSPTGGSAEDSFTGRFGNTYSSSYFEFAQTAVASSTVNGITGWWVTNTGTATLASNQALSSVKTYASTYVFTERVYRNGVGWGYYKVNGVSTSKVVITAAVAPTPGATTPASFKVGGVLISNIPTSCTGVDFVVSAYGATGSTATTLISSGATNVKEVAVYYTRIPGSAVSSIDRTTTASSSLVSASQTSGTIKITFDTASGTPLLATDLYKLVVETQQEAIG